MMIGFLGVMPLLITSTNGEQIMGELLFISLPEFALLLAIVFHCYGMIVARKLVRDSNQPASLTILAGLRLFL